MPRYYTGLKAWPEEAVGFPFQAKAWVYDVVDHDPLGTYSSISQPAPREVVIEASTEALARRANDLVWAAFTIVTGGELSIDLFNLDRTLTEEYVAIKQNQIQQRHYMCEAGGIPLACEIAAMASFRRSTIYACMKMYFSHDCCTTSLVDLDPHFATETFIPTKREVFHVRLAQAIVLAYGAIEELGLEVRASNKRPSSLPDGTWNPEVKQELEARLTKSGIDLADRFNWTIRGGKTRLERDKPRNIHRNATKSPWTRWTVRDRMIDIVDAIAHASWLRSQVASHRLRAERAGLLTAYDVANMQFLVRRLLYEKLGIWKREVRRAADAT
jgi:hypothetical protein